MSGSKLCFVVTVLPLPFAVNASEDCTTHHEDLLPCSDFHVPPPDIGKQGEDSEDLFERLVGDSRQIIAAQDGREREEDV